jgi:hypothetical protein
MIIGPPRPRAIRTDSVRVKFKPEFRERWRPGQPSSLSEMGDRTPAGLPVIPWQATRLFHAIRVD